MDWARTIVFSYYDVPESEPQTQQLCTSLVSCVPSEAVATVLQQP